MRRQDLLISYIDQTMIDDCPSIALWNSRTLRKNGGMYCHLFLNVNGARYARHRNEYVPTETNGVDLKHFETAPTPFNHTSSIATPQFAWRRRVTRIQPAPNERPGNDEQHFGRPP
jgi:hypothetical protein